MKPLLILLLSLFVAMIGFGVTLPVLPFFTERLITGEAASREAIALHVGALTAVFACMQLLMAPAWGHVSDRRGRKWPLVIGIAGAGVGQFLFATATSLWLLYGARIFTGLMAAAAFPIASAYVADLTGRMDRARGMAWMGTTASLGVIGGLVLGGLTAREDIHFRLGLGHFLVDRFSVPFLLSGILMFLAAGVAALWMSDSAARVDLDAQESRTAFGTLVHNLKWLLGLSFAAQLGLALFEGTFALYARERLGAGPSEVAIAFLVCGVVMAAFQPLIVRYLSPLLGSGSQIAVGFSLAGTGLGLVVLASSLLGTIGFVAILALGMAIVYPNLATLVSMHGEAKHGTALGMQNAANSLGQAAGPLIGTSLFVWRASIPYVFGGVLMLTIAIAVGWWRARPQLAVPR